MWKCKSLETTRRSPKHSGRIPENPTYPPRTQQRNLTNKSTSTFPFMFIRRYKFKAIKQNKRRIQTASKSAKRSVKSRAKRKQKDEE